VEEIQTEMALALQVDLAVAVALQVEDLMLVVLELQDKVLLEELVKMLTAAAVAALAVLVLVGLQE
jgi:hypothetical protein